MSAGSAQFSAGARCAANHHSLHLDNCFIDGCKGVLALQMHQENHLPWHQGLRDGFSMSRMI